MNELPDPHAPLENPQAVFGLILSGRVEDAEIARFLVGLAERGETVEEIEGAARALRQRMVAVEAPPGAVDVCGTGGDGAHTRNISTAVAIVLASCGVPVAKHGNRAASSKSGAADVLSELGLNLDLEPQRVEASINEIGIGFLFAARHHPVMARVAPVRRALGRRTIFNLLGPLANPAGVDRQLVGVYDERWTRPLAEALQRLGAVHALTVHGDGGLDELALSGPSIGAELAGGKIEDRRMTPEDAGLQRHALEAIRGGTPAENAAALIALLEGRKDAYRDIVILNTAAALTVAGRAESLADGAHLAQIALDDGASRQKLEDWRQFA